MIVTRSETKSRIYFLLPGIARQSWWAFQKLVKWKRCPENDFHITGTGMCPISGDSSRALRLSRSTTELITSSEKRPVVLSQRYDSAQTVRNEWILYELINSKPAVPPQFEQYHNVSPHDDDRQLAACDVRHDYDFKSHLLVQVHSIRACLSSSSTPRRLWKRLTWGKQQRCTSVLFTNGHWLTQTESRL
jgi:hypothetical protein